MRRRALLCGINDYKSVRDLRGCVSDVRNMQALLREVYGFREEEVRVLTDRDVTKARLKREWKWLMTGAGPGDTLVFHFSGHGSFLPDREGEDEDGNDELLCLYDMDFNKPTTYLLDDELDAWTQKKPDGADLVIVTDCCHSGTNTRMVLEDLDGRLLAYALDQEATFQLAERTGRDPDAMEVVARFLPPPNYVPSREASLRGAPRRRTRPLNHLHLAACQDHETAADAPIDGAYHGAFTYHLCRALRADPRLGSAELMTRLHQTLSIPPFSQTPRENGGPRPGPIFAGDPPRPGPDTTANEPVRPSAERPAATGADLGEATARELITAVRELTAALGGGRARLSLPAREAGRRTLVYVHGISEHPGDYSLDWWNAMRPHVNGLFGDGQLGVTRIGVHWSDIVNARAVREPSPEADFMRRMIVREVEERAARYAERDGAHDRGARSAARMLATRGDGPQIDDFLRYMFQTSVRSEVLARFTDAVRPRLADGEVLDIISHSWGTVVAYEGLLQLETEGLPGRVANFFTVGSALSIGLVRWQLGLSGNRPAQVGRWVNLDAKGDGIGGGIASHFPVDFEYLDLDPTGCTRGWFGYSLGCAHSSYFRSENLAVNRDIFGWFIRTG